MNHAKEIKALLERDEDLSPSPGAVEKLIELLLARENELATPDPPRGTISWYFGKKDSSKEALEALIEAAPELLLAWIEKKKKDEDFMESLRCKHCGQFH